MYEDVSIESLFTDMMAQIPQAMDKRPSSLSYLMLMPTAIELKQLYLALNYVLSNCYADTADREHLIERAKEASLAPNAATATRVTGKFNIAIAAGQRFTTGKYVFFATEAATLNSEDGFYYAPLESETAGIINDEDYLGLAIMPITINGKTQLIQDLTTATISAIVERGDDEEGTEDFRRRYFSVTKWDSYGGNIADYKRMLGTIPGIGGNKVVPVWQGGGTVKLVVIDSAYKAPGSAFLASLQEKIDPLAMTGMGYGMAPIDHRVTVAAPDELPVNIAFNITLQSGQTWESVQADVKAAIEGYFDAQRKRWEESQGLIIRTTYIESAVLELPTVVDIRDTTLNGMTNNVRCTEYQLPVVGTVSGTVVE